MAIEPEYFMRERDDLAGPALRCGLATLCALPIQQEPPLKTRESRLKAHLVTRPVKIMD
jgi:hypothetical protein